MSDELVQIAHGWAKRKCEHINGQMITWDQVQMDSYHRDLGLLIDFVTDCETELRNLKPPTRIFPQV